MSDNFGTIFGSDTVVRCTLPAKKEGRGPTCNGFAGRVYVPHGQRLTVVGHVKRSDMAPPGLVVLPCTRCGGMNVVNTIPMEATG